MDDADSMEEEIKQHIRKEKFFLNTTITQFSDSFIISKGSGNVNGIETLVLDTNHIFLMGIYYHFLFRGAITEGKMIHNDEFVFGPGFVKAYEMENKEALYPRVIVDTKIVEKYINQSTILRDLVKPDDNGLYYIDIFKGLDYQFTTEKSKKIILSILKGLINKGLECDDDKTKSKYEWLDKKYNDYISSK